MNIPAFSFEGNALEIVDEFSYLGVKFSYDGKCAKTKYDLLEQARMAMFSIILKARNLDLPISMQIHLFDTCSMVAPILLYGSEVWGIEYVNIIDRFELRFYKFILNLKQSTENCMLYGDSGIYALFIKSRVFVLLEYDFKEQTRINMPYLVTMICHTLCIVEMC
jgi:hypothetical protein